MIESAVADVIRPAIAAEQPYGLLHKMILFFDGICDFILDRRTCICFQGLQKIFSDLSCIFLVVDIVEPVLCLRL